MFCPNCGQTLADGSRFCANCGNALAPAQNPIPAAPQVPDPMQQFQTQKSAVRNSELLALDRVIPHFTQVQNVYDAYEATWEKVKLFSRGAKKSLIVWGAIVLALSFLLDLLILVASSSGSASSDLGPVLILLLLPGVLMIVGGILMQVVSRSKYRKFQQEFVQLSHALYQHYTACPDCPVGYEYSNPQILALLRNTLQSGRADTIKEGLNTLLDSANNRAMQHYLQDVPRCVQEFTSQPVIFMLSSFFH